MIMRDRLICYTRETMEPDMKPLNLMILIILVAGIVLVGMSAGYSVYTDQDAPGRLSMALKDLPRETRFKEWNRQLNAFETPYKRLNDSGWGLIAAAAGLLLAAALWKVWHRTPQIRTMGIVMLIWFSLWLIRIPLVFRFYLKRQERFDYPVWGDSIGIPVYTDSFGIVVLAVLSAVVLGLLRINHPLPHAIKWHRPATAWSWFRAMILSLWLLMLAYGIVFGIWAGDEGAVLCSLPAAVILLAFFAARAQPAVETATKAEPVSPA